MTAARREAQQAVKAIESMGHATVSSMQASSAAIRVLEGGMTGNIRAAERFISLIPGVGKALQTAFPIVGGIALAGVFVKIGEEAAKAIQKIEQAEQSITNSFRTLNLSGLTANDTLAITNDRLENEIAKLQGKPENNLKIAIDEARLAADKMADSLDRDNAKIKELLSQNAVPWWAGFLGKAGTSDVSKTVNAQNQHLADLAAQANILQHQGDQAGADRVRGQIDSTRQQYLRDNTADIANRRANQNLPGGLNQGANVSIDLGQQSSLLNQIDQENQLKRNLADQAQKQRLDDIKAQQEAARRALEAAKQAQEQIVQQWHKAFDEAKADSDMTVVQEAQFWVQRMETARKGSLSYIAALDEVNRDIAQMRAQNMRGQAEFDKTSAINPSSMDLSRGAAGEMSSQGKGAIEYLKNLNEGIRLQHQNADAIAETSIALQLATGQMSKLDAAQARAALHTQEYAEATNEITAALRNAQALPEGFEKQQRIAGLNNQQTQITGQRQIQILSDQQGISGNTVSGAIKQSLDQMVTSFTDMASSLKTIIPQTVDSLNGDIVKALTGHGSKADFGKTFEQAGQSLLKSGLQSLEGNLLKGFGLGKPDGTASNPIYTIDASQSLGGGSLPPFVQSTFPGQQQGQNGNGQQSQQGGWSGFGSILKGLSKTLFKGQQQGGDGGGDDDNYSTDSDGWPQGFQGGFARGGDVLANRPALVGEHGRELFLPRTAGRIIPNSELGGGGGGDTHVYNIDARGSNDPMAVHAAVARALPHAVAASVQANHQSRMRSPGGR